MVVVVNWGREEGKGKWSPGGEIAGGGRDR